MRSYLLHRSAKLCFSVLVEGDRVQERGWMHACMQRGLTLRRFHKRISVDVRTVECGEKVPKRDGSTDF